MWRSITPQLPVSDVAASQRWYRDVLGFEIAWTRGESFGAVRAQGVELFLARSDAPAATTVCVLVDDADFAYAVCRERRGRSSRRTTPGDARVHGARPDGLTGSATPATLGHAR
jgi:catechol 2,3-dioxygenase-like lactoylglutathione lyase family enzyme